MITIVIPARNEEENLPALLESLKNQTYKKEFEVIVIDGKSTDRTVEIAKKYGARVIRRRKNLTVANARNLGWKNAKGDVIDLVEADHVFDKNYVKNIDEAFKKGIDVARHLPTPIAHNWIEKTLAIQVELVNERIGNYEHATTFRKKILEEVGGYDDSLGFGDERLLPRKIIERGYKIVFLKNIKSTVKVVGSVRRLFRQGRWYGKNIIPYVKKSRDYIILFGIGVYSLTLPSFIIGIFFRPFLYLGILGLLALLWYSVKGFLITKKYHAFLIPVINTIRGTGELLGMMRYMIGNNERI
jgi:glycosyltransferase involved in cell wall biosynthesis